MPPHLRKEIDETQRKDNSKKDRSAVRDDDHNRQHIEESHEEGAHRAWNDFIDGVDIFAKPVDNTTKRSGVEETLQVKETKLVNSKNKIKKKQRHAHSQFCPQHTNRHISIQFICVGYLHNGEHRKNAEAMYM